MKHPSSLAIQDFTYELPPGKIAAYPLEKRDASKLLVFRNRQISESTFEKMPDFLEKGSLLVFNNARVIPARLLFLNARHKAIEVFCLEPAGEQQDLSIALSARQSVRWHCLVGNLKNWKTETLHLEMPGFRLSAVCIERAVNYVVVDFSWEPAALCFAEVLEALGQMPIPPYLKRASDKTDETRYQTVYAQKQGSVAAPTAGLHFTGAVLDQLRARSVQSLNVTLHVGAGTFKPVKSETLQGHEMHAEWIEVDLQSLQLLLEQVENRIIAVGTTSLRTIETLYWMGAKTLLKPQSTLTELEIKQWDPYQDWADLPTARESLSALLRWVTAHGLAKIVCRTQILIAPPYELKIAAGLITNFHQPQSTLLLLIATVVGNDWKKIYEYALAHEFRFLSYGDSSLLLK